MGDLIELRNIVNTIIVKASHTLVESNRHLYIGNYSVCIDRLAEVEVLVTQAHEAIDRELAERRGEVYVRPDTTIRHRLWNDILILLRNIDVRAPEDSTNEMVMDARDILVRLNEELASSEVEVEKYQAFVKLEEEELDDEFEGAPKLSLSGVIIDEGG